VSQGQKKRKVELSEALISDITHKLEQAEHYWVEFVSAGRPIPGDIGKTRKFQQVIERWEKAVSRKSK